MDLSKLSDETLLSLRAGKGVDYSKIPDSDLLALSDAGKPAEPMGWGEYIGRGVTDALPVAGMAGGGLLGSAAAPIAGSVAGAGLGFAGGSEAKGLLNHYMFGDALPNTAPIEQAKRVAGNVQEGVEGELGGKAAVKGAGLLMQGADKLNDATGGYAGKFTKKALKYGLAHYAGVPWMLTPAVVEGAEGTLNKMRGLLPAAESTGVQSAESAIQKGLLGAENGEINQAGAGAGSGAGPTADAGSVPAVASPLKGLPENSPGPTEKIRQAAQQYAQENNVAPSAHTEYAKADPARGARIAQAYEDMAHDPGHPEVKKAYDALIKETKQQYQKIKDLGINVEVIKPGMPNPYPNGSPDMISDVRKGHIWVFPTEGGFGSGATAEHPLLAPTGEKIGDHELLANDMFRVVHDVFGHAKEGVGFGPHGEENAWRSHLGMFSPDAQKAMTSETRGQNSWVNFGPHATNNTLNKANTVYADQKAGILPDWAMKDGLTATVPDKRNIVISPIIDELSSFRKMLPGTSGQDIDSLITELKAMNRTGKVSASEFQSVKDRLKQVLSSEDTGPQLRRAAVLAQDATNAIRIPGEKIDPFTKKRMVK